MNIRENLTKLFQKGLFGFSKISKTAKIGNKKENDLYWSRLSLWDRFRYTKTVTGPLYGETVL